MKSGKLRILGTTFVKHFRKLNCCLTSKWTTVKIQHPLQISKDSLVVVWKDSSNGLPGQFDPWQTYMKHVTSRGHKVILAAPWYLNIISYGQDWRRYYVVEPTNFTGANSHNGILHGDI